jgi:hypothetical protein
MKNISHSKAPGSSVQDQVQRIVYGNPPAMTQAIKDVRKLTLGSTRQTTPTSVATLAGSLWEIEPYA